MLTSLKMYANEGAGQIWYHMDLLLEEQSCSQAGIGLDLAGERIWDAIDSQAGRLIWPLRKAIEEPI